jgi:predicted nucleotidyltransferase
VSATEPTPYPELNAVLRELVAGVGTVLGERFTAAYLLGSFAIGDFDADSDVDFLVAIEHEVPADRLGALRDLHRRIHALDSHWAKRLDGSYVPEHILRRRDPTRTPLLYLDNGSRELVASDHCNTLVVRWMARERGIRLAGPEPASLIDPVPVDDLREEVAALMRGWAAEIRADPERMDNRWYQPYAVLSYCRMLYTIQTGTIASKPAAASWAQGALDGRWSGLIQRALDERPDPSRKVRQRADPEDFERTLAFLDYALRRLEA